VVTGSVQIRQPRIDLGNLEQQLGGQQVGLSVVRVALEHGPYQFRRLLHLGRVLGRQTRILELGRPRQDLRRRHLPLLGWRLLRAAW